MQTTVSGPLIHQAAAPITLSSLSSTNSSITSLAGSNQAITSSHQIKPEVAQYSLNNSELRIPQEIY